MASRSHLYQEQDILPLTMELKYSIATIFLLFLLLLLHLPPFTSYDNGKMNNEAGVPPEEVYQIDYRGPETHPVMPFPSRDRPRKFRPEHPHSKPPSKTSESKVSSLHNITVMESIKLLANQSHLEFPPNRIYC
ncbi:hypothetical protein SAY87_018988 [Trapa incisa]|uniref:Uncharacterized protein n=1 Tax=Trapa incisa TaxID=236973 RepID=A0AAN7K3W0_9MYRT|nr:hypothetical protein SAY87_018988 [Trapa incisa]